MILEKIQATVKNKWPIRETDGPGYRKDCPIRVAFIMQQRHLASAMLMASINVLLMENRNKLPEEITCIIDQFIDGYQSTDIS